MHIPVIDGISLTAFRRDDKAACVARIRDREIYDRTLRIPRPYTEEHFDEWLGIVAAEAERHGEPVHFVIREGGSLIGSVGFDGLVKGHKAEIGYWLARPWWGRGIMTAAVGAACEHAVARWHLVRIAACVFESNAASARVLEKNGFDFEGLLRRHHLKDGQLINSRLFSLLP